jgi:hypothetical protein
MSIFSDIFSGGISGIISPITNAITAIFTKQQDTVLGKYVVDGKVDVSLLQEDTKRLQAQADLNKVLSQYTGDRWIRYLFMAPVGIWFTFYMFDSTFRGLIPSYTWRVLTPEPQVMMFITWIVGFIFLHTTITTSLRK